MNIKFFLKATIACLILTSTQIITALITKLSFNFDNLAWLLLSNFLTCFVLSLCVVYSRLRGYELILVTFLIAFVIGSFNILVEAFIFDVTSTAQTLRALVQSVLYFSIVSAVLVYLFEKQRFNERETITFRHRSYGGWVWRVVASVFGYLIFYIAAGVILQLVFPGLMEFYKGKIPAFSLIFVTQVIRGLIFTGVAVLFLRSCVMQTSGKAILIGIIFAIIGGVAPLLSPNELMPSNVRLAHGFEVGISNFLFGLLIGYLLDQKPEPDQGVLDRT